MQRIKKKLLSIYIHIVGRAAHRYIYRSGAIVIGITGSVGKTSCRGVIYDTMRQILPDLDIYSSSKNLNGELGLPMSILQIQSSDGGLGNISKNLGLAIYRGLFTKAKYDIAILEYGIDRIGEMDWMLNICKPDFAILTNIGQVHSSQLGDMNHIFSEKSKLCKAAKQMAMLNKSDPIGYSLVDKLDIDVLSFDTHIYSSVDKPTKTLADIYCDNLSIQINQDNHICLSYIGHIKDKTYQMSIGDITDHSCVYAMMGLTLAQIISYQNQDISHISDKLKYHIDISKQSGRGSIIPGIYPGRYILDASYNAAPQSMHSTIDISYKIIESKVFGDTKSIAVIGDMKELDKYSHDAHVDIGDKLMNYDEIYLIGHEVKYTAHRLMDLGYNMSHVHIYANRKAAQGHLVSDLDPKQRYLITAKGSQSIHIEEVVKELINPDKHHLLPRQSTRRMSKKYK